MNIVRMKTMRTLCVIAVATLLAGSAGADVHAVITKAGGSGQKISGTVQWLAMTKQYSVQPDGSPVIYKLSPREVANIRVDRPPELDASIRLVQAGRYAEALPKLEKIMREYIMLEHDVTAAQYLAYGYLKTKEPRKAAKMCEIVLSSNPDALQSESFAAMYWQALLETDQYEKLAKALTTAIERGSREVAAVAQIKRGDMAKQKGNLDDALVDGYLRTIVFFEAIKGVQPEALYKAAKCFEEKGQHPYAEKMRRLLLSGYPTSEYAQKVKSGV